jgi:hypothetical protein
MDKRKQTKPPTRTVKKTKSSTVLQQVEQQPVSLAACFTTPAPVMRPIQQYPIVLGSTSSAAEDPSNGVFQTSEFLGNVLH